MSMFLDDVPLPDLILEPTAGSAAVRVTRLQTLGGRPLLLEDAVPLRAWDLAGGEDRGWISRSCLDRLLALAAVPGAVYRLHCGEGPAMVVRFRHEDGPAVAGEPVLRACPASPDDPVNNLRLKLMEVTA